MSVQCLCTKLWGAGSISQACHLSPWGSPLVTLWWMGSFPHIPLLGRDHL